LLLLLEPEKMKDMCFFIVNDSKAKNESAEVGPLQKLEVNNKVKY